ncbi:hypothetical protein F4604DRAFT_1687900 [Suillus subluteus]|nr:hypothetical protein F4604DRAFT_1687900 [Suillus subluteus]
MQQARITELTKHLGCTGYSGWLFTGKVNGKFVAMSISQVLSTVFCPYVSTLKGANLVFLVCGTTVAYKDSFVELKDAVLDLDIASTIMFSTMWFQPLVTSNFLLAMAELVVVEQLNLHKIFPTLLSLSDGPWLSTATFACAHMQTQLWGIKTRLLLLARSKASRWFQSSPIIFAPPPSVPSFSLTSVSLSTEAFDRILALHQNRCKAEYEFDRELGTK